MKKTIQIDCNSWQIGEDVEKKLEEMGVIEKYSTGEVKVIKEGTLIIEFIED
jgi:hypothetical protein